MRSGQAEAYNKAQCASMTDREREAAVLMKAAALLRHAQMQWATAQREKLLDEALRFNQRIWTFFQVSLSDQENRLPDEIKAQVLTLSAYVDRRIFEVMAFPEADKLSVLIAINTNLAAGLKGSAASS
ncbi:MAG: flagellar biosynthesis regulator FlaF [Ignavibacteriae bacterium]|nr:flagellar biosynthesis regulator FlaF [Ignavibacteriota bacterium]